MTSSTLKSAALACIAFFASNAAFAQIPTRTPAVVEDICSSTFATSYEGSYTGKVGQSDVRLNLVCADTKRMLASLTFFVDLESRGSVASAFVSFGHVAIDGGRLILSSFGIDQAERAGASSKIDGGYIKLDLQALAGGLASGTYINGTQPHFQKLSARRAQKFPQPPPSPAAPVPAAAFYGEFAFVSKNAGDVAMAVDVLAGVPVFNMVGSGGYGIHLIDAAPWDTSGTFRISTVLGDNEPDGHNLHQVRGRVLDAKTLELYLISPNAGLEGPLKAIKQNSLFLAPLAGPGSLRLN